MLGTEDDIRKGVNHVRALGVLRLCDLVHYYFQLKVVNLVKMKKDDLLAIIDPHLQLVDDAGDDNAVKKEIVGTGDEHVPFNDDANEGQYDMV